jgi:hypothetical protein
VSARITPPRKAPERHRQADRSRHPAGGERHQQRDRGEDLLVLGAHDQQEHGPHDEARDQRRRRECRDRFRQR